ASAEGGEGDADDGGATLEAAAAFVLPTLTNLPALAANANATLLIAGVASPSAGEQPLTVRLFRDDSELTGGAASLRAVNALPQAGSLDLGLGSSATKWTA